jgi:hypothetical protein
MTFVPIMWIVWSSLVLITAVLYIYRSRLCRDEDGQIFLDDCFDHEKNMQASIVAKVNKVQPIIHVMQWVVVGMTTVVLVYYVRDILVHLNVIGS